MKSLLIVLANSRPNRFYFRRRAHALSRSCLLLFYTWWVGYALHVAILLFWVLNDCPIFERQQVGWRFLLITLGVMKSSARLKISPLLTSNYSTAGVLLFGYRIIKPTASSFSILSPFEHLAGNLPGISFNVESANLFIALSSLLCAPRLLTLQTPSFWWWMSLLARGTALHYAWYPVQHVLLDHASGSHCTAVSTRVTLKHFLSPN